MKKYDGNIDYVELDLASFEEKDLLKILFTAIEKSDKEMVYITAAQLDDLGPDFIRSLASFDEEGVDMILPQNYDGDILMLGALYKKSSLVSIGNLMAEGETNIEELIYESWAKVVTARQLGSIGDLLPQEGTRVILSRYLGNTGSCTSANEHNPEKQLFLKIIPGTFSVCKVSSQEDIPLNLEYCFTGRTDQEFSLLCPVEAVPGKALEREDGWKGFRVQGILDFSLIGILAPIAQILADHGIGIFVVSTFNTDYIFVKEEHFQEALILLEKAGYGILQS